MTLLELMLVLGLLVMIGAMSMPALRRPFEHHRLRQGGEVVRVEWNKARIKAMKTGQMQMFRYTANANDYQVLPYFSQQDWLETDADQAASSPRQLPEGVVFVQGEVETDSRSYEVQRQMQGAGTAGGLDSAPVLFYPDGTTSDARVVLTNQYQKLFVVVSLRSLTGITKVSNLLTSDELQQLP
jgi:Tfp pilus assembly protein FimT